MTRKLSTKYIPSGLKVTGPALSGKPRKGCPNSADGLCASKDQIDAIYSLVIDLSTSVKDIFEDHDKTHDKYELTIEKLANQLVEVSNKVSAMGSDTRIQAIRAEIDNMQKNCEAFRGEQHNKNTHMVNESSEISDEQSKDKALIASIDRRLSALELLFADQKTEVDGNLKPFVNGLKFQWKKIAGTTMLLVLIFKLAQDCEPVRNIILSLVGAKPPIINQQPQTNP